jgi:hypothetical protein
MLKFVIVAAASLALVGSAVAADMPRPQPVVQNAPIGKYPIGKYPVGNQGLNPATRLQHVSSFEVGTHPMIGIALRV